MCEIVCPALRCRWTCIPKAGKQVTSLSSEFQTAHLLQMRIPPQWCSTGGSHGKRKGVGVQMTLEFTLMVHWKCTRPDTCIATACVA